MTFADTVTGMFYKMVLESAIMAAKKKKKNPEESIAHPESSQPKIICTYLCPAREKPGTKMGRF